LLKAAFLDPLPYRDAGRLITIMEMEKNGWVPSTAEFVEIRARNRSFDQIAFAEHRDMQLSGSGEPVRVFAARVTASFFPLLGVSASLGRTFLDEENQPGRTPAVVLTDAFWRSKMGADTRAVGKTLRLDGQPALVVGVLPPKFHFRTIRRWKFQNPWTFTSRIRWSIPIRCIRVEAARAFRSWCWHTASRGHLRAGRRRSEEHCKGPHPRTILPHFRISDMIPAFFTS